MAVIWNPLERASSSVSQPVGLIWYPPRHLIIIVFFVGLLECIIDSQREVEIQSD